ncbi:MAG: hypothetical protein RLY71_1406 [Pseudomonadota bacterium]|jgi:methyl-accepting chemotaxis protein
MKSLESWLRGYTIRLRMIGAIVMVLGLFALLGAISLGAGQHLQSLNHHFIEHSMQESGHMADIRAALGEVRRHEKDMVIDYADGAALKAHRERWQAAIDATRASLTAMLAGDEDEDNPLAREAITRLADYQKSTGETIDRVQADAYDSAQTINRVLDRAKLNMDVVEDRVQKMGVIVRAEAVATEAEIESRARQTMLVFLVVLALVVVVVTPLTLLNSRSIVGPIEAARTLAQNIARGDLSGQVEVRGRDEASELMTALRGMQTALAGMVGDIRQTTESISTASTQIATGNQDLSSRTEQTASSLQQTASSMEQLNSTVRQTAESARTANQLASSAAQAAQRGGAVVSQVVHNMEDITTSSRKIAEIIGVIDGIAFQTNILALNAAVEAARAGEQGRGFAVVAGEVRNLAQRSANAAREIKSLIGASVDKVESGSRLVQEAGGAMNEIVAGVQRVSDIIGEITAAASEQSGELGQVNVAVTQLDQMTQQNAALVEQSAAAAESLREQAQRLADVVHKFNVGSGAVPMVATPVPRPATARHVSPAQTHSHRAPAASVAKAAASAPVVASRPVAAATADDDWETF